MYSQRTHDYVTSRKGEILMIIHRDGKTFVEVEIPKSNCVSCLFCSFSIYDGAAYCNFIHKTIGVFDSYNSVAKHKDCPSLRKCSDCKGFKDIENVCYVYGIHVEPDGEICSDYKVPSLRNEENVKLGQPENKLSKLIK